MSGATSTEVTVTMGSSSASASRSSSSASTCRNTWLTRNARGYVAVRRFTASAPHWKQLETIRNNSEQLGLVLFERSDCSGPGDLALVVGLNDVAVLEVLEVRE